MTPSDSLSIVPAPHRLSADGATSIRGAGLARVVVSGDATVVLHAGRDVPYTWVGTAAARAPSSDERVWALADGVLEVHGSAFVVEVAHGHVEAEVAGRFELFVADRGCLVAADGSRLDVGPGRHTVRVDGPRVEAAPTRGVAA